MRGSFPTGHHRLGARDTRLALGCGATIMKSVCMVRYTEYGNKLLLLECSGPSGFQDTTFRFRQRSSDPRSLIILPFHCSVALEGSSLAPTPLTPRLKLSRVFLLFYSSQAPNHFETAEKKSQVFRQTSTSVQVPSAVLYLHFFFFFSSVFPLFLFSRPQSL